MATGHKYDILRDKGQYISQNNSSRQSNISVPIAWAQSFTGNATRAR